MISQAQNPTRPQPQTPLAANLKIGRKMKKISTLAVLLIGTCAAFAGQSPEEKAVWKLEHSYWEYVKALDLESYRNLWHPNFVGWPSSSAKPARKDHITDWIAASTAKGLHLESYELKPAASQATENVVVTHYWLTERWADKDGQGKSDTIRLTHTWIRTPGGWQIIGGMAAPVTKPTR
jgi:Domain of unknown function (DUF4440)